MVGGILGVPDGNQQKREEKDRRIGKWALWATIASAISASVAAAVGFGALIETDRQLTESKSQTDILRFQGNVARDAYLAADRPWVAYAKPEARKPTSGATWSGGRLHLVLEFDLKNAGHSPALKVRGAIGPLRKPSGIPMPTDERCSGYTEPGLIDPALGHFILPDGDWEQPVYGIDFAGPDLPTRGNLAGPVRLVACVAYTRTGQDEFKTSRRVFDVGVKDAGSPNGWGPFHVGVNVPNDSLVIREDIGGNYAD